MKKDCGRNPPCARRVAWARLPQRQAGARAAPALTPSRRVQTRLLRLRDAERFDGHILEREEAEVRRSPEAGTRHSPPLFEDAAPAVLLKKRFCVQ
jgi:hypothetical protein